MKPKILLCFDESEYPTTLEIDLQIIPRIGESLDLRQFGRPYDDKVFHIFEISHVIKKSKIVKDYYTNSILISITSNKLQAKRYIDSIN